jgi:ABC-type multidrug transport system fused ATPase/permease subunit
MSYFHNKQTGELMSRVVNDTATFELLYAHILPDTVTNFVTVIGVMVILLTINPKLALLTCIPIPFIAMAGRLFVTKIQPYFKESQKAIAGINAKLQDNFSGIHEIQSFNREASEAEAIRIQANGFTKAMLYALKLSAVFHPSVEFLSSLGTIIVVGFGGFFAYKQQLSVEDVVAFLLYLSLFYGPIAGIARLLEDMQQAYAGAERVMTVLDTPEEIQNEADAKPLTNVSGSIEFRNVSFAYQEESPVLCNVSFECKAGQMIALVGPTGVGKTTATQLVSRFYDPVEGQVLIDSQDIRHVTLESLRNCIAPVLQDTYLFNGTIEENIAYSVQHATHEEIVEAAKAAQIHTTILEMPNGYQTQVGERGIRLSGGQKQRVAIARAILRKSPIIILDEATASVDTTTERQIQDAIDLLAQGRTIIAIAHRLSTIQKANMILVLQDGAIVQQGTHAELIQQDGLYRSLHEDQAPA